MLESKVEQKLVEECRRRGWLCLKFVSPGKAGVPDRLIVAEGLHVFVEVKAPGEQPRKLQEARHRQMREAGATVIVVDTIEDVELAVTAIAMRIKEVAQRTKRIESFLKEAWLNGADI